jgi:predicted CxxxxCH...CXXCH cytochrome family protein
MAFPVHSFRELRRSALSLALLVAFAGIAGCGSDKSSGGMVSPPGWVVLPSGGQHATSATLTYISNGGTSSCAECHGADLFGGTSKVSCFENPTGCHHGPVANWATPSVHGATAKQAPGSPRFASCQLCHGADFRTPRGDGNETCYSCHSLAPHPDGPWRSSTGSTHTNTDPSNAPVCAGCHRNNTPGTPGCFNSTLCHGEPAVVPHPVGSAWVATSPAAQPHANDAKATPGATTGFTYCQVCHGTGADFAGGTSGVSCYPCHVPTSSSPHASQWRTGDTYVHTTTAEGNAAVCAFCHLNGANSPVAPPSPPAPAGTAAGCFNNTLCHNGGGGGTTHAVPYNDPAHFGVSDAAFPADCGTCHDDFAPSTKVGPVCRTCHVAASPLTSLNCTSCHGDPPSGATYPNAAGKHAVHDGLPGVGVCNPCHNGLDAGTLEHYNRANARPGKDALRVPPGDVAFLGTYNAQSGPAAFDPANLTCSNVICHGGQATPDWQTPEADAIDVVNACTSCHVAGTTQYNSYFSGRHDTHITEFGLSATTCKLCHDVAKVNVTGHFQNLATPEFEQAPGETILLDVQYIDNTCSPTGDLTGCHAGNPNRNRPWF